MLTLGNGDPYVAATGHRPIDTTWSVDNTPKVTGLDWDALTPKCSVCGQRRGDVDLTTGLCPLCAAAVVVRPTPELPTPARATADVEKTAGPAQKGKKPSGPANHHGGPRRISTRGEIAAVCLDYLNGHSQAEVGRRNGMSQTKVSRILRQEGVETREPVADRNSSVLTDAQRDTAVARFNAGDRLAHIARDLGVDRRTLYGLLERAGVNPTRKKATK